MSRTPSSVKQSQAPHERGGYSALWKRIEKRLDGMNKEEKLQTFVSAGILTPKGNPTKPYRGVFVKATKA